MVGFAGAVVSSKNENGELGALVLPAASVTVAETGTLPSGNGERLPAPTGTSAVAPMSPATTV